MPIPAAVRPTDKPNAYRGVGGAVGDQSGDGQRGRFEVLAPSDPALQGPPLPGLGNGMFDADSRRGLVVAFLLPAGGLFGWRVLAGFLRRGADLAGEVTGQALGAGVDLGLDLGMAAQQVFDPLRAQRGDIVHPAGPERAQPQQPPVPVADRGGLDGVLLLLAGHERVPVGRHGCPAADLTAILSGNAASLPGL
jgi:hypothetical protein